MLTVAELIHLLFPENQLLKAVLSSPMADSEAYRISIRPILIKGENHFQWTYETKNQAFHKNIDANSSAKLLEAEILNFRQAQFQTVQFQFHLLRNRKGDLRILRKPQAQKLVPELVHNKAKCYILQEGMPVPYLVEMGVMNAEGRVYPDKMDKFRQINKFLEFIEGVLAQIPQKEKFHVIDFGCGKAYLTFALYDFLTRLRQIEAVIIGLDLKEDVIKRCQNLSKKLSYGNLTFQQGNIENYQEKGPIDLVVCLHACDTATDAALAKAVAWNSQAILAVPCCQHEIFEQIAESASKPLLKHGILKERLASLVTDAARAELLELSGYHTQVIEFIDLEHTAKNILIKAIKKKGPSAKTWDDYVRFKKHWSFEISLEKFLNP